MTHHIDGIVGPMLDASLDKHAGTDEVLWQGQLMPSPQNRGEALYVVFFWVKGHVLGTVVQGSFAIQNPLDINAEDIDEIVADFLRQMREARSADVASQMPVEEPIQRGQARSSGLLIP
jgi:hypothetical protein